MIYYTAHPNGKPSELQYLLGSLSLDKLLRAIAIVETEDGRNNWPRVESSYLPKGERYTVQGRIIAGTGLNVNQVVMDRWRKFGLPTAASWGPWQILYHTAADRGFDGPPHLLHDGGLSSIFVRSHLHTILLDHARTIEDIADAWNSGNHHDDIVPHDYQRKLREAYLSL